jgi:hypothetical protein
MKKPSTDWSRPERFLLLLARGGGESRGKAIRLNDSSELRFESLSELVAWLESRSVPSHEVDP